MTAWGKYASVGVVSLIVGFLFGLAWGFGVAVKHEEFYVFTLKDLAQLLEPIILATIVTILIARMSYRHDKRGQLVAHTLDEIERIAWEVISSHRRDQNDPEILVGIGTIERWFPFLQKIQREHQIPIKKQVYEAFLGSFLDLKKALTYNYEPKTHKRKKNSQPDEQSVQQQIDRFMRLIAEYRLSSIR